VGLVERRIGLLFAVFLVLLVLAGGRAGWLGLVEARGLQKVAVGQQQETLEIPAERGAITDDKGTELAVSQPAMTIAATPYLIRHKAQVAKRLSSILRIPEAPLLKKISREDTGFVYLAKEVPVARARKAQNLEIDKVKIDGLEFIPEYRRDYPRKWMASQVIGTVGSDDQGLAGLEHELDRALSGSAGERHVVKDAIGQPIAMRDTKTAVPGKDVRLTLDAAIQDEAERVLADVGAKWKPKGATAVVMDPRDGSILALANWPRVNANALYDAPDYARGNRAIGAVYEPGSTFKAITVAGALQDDKITENTSFALPPTLTVADRTIHDAEDRGWETLTTSGILRVSSNIGAVMIGQKLGAPRFDHWVRRFGFGEPTGVDLPGEEQGIVPTLAKYSGSSMGNLPIGQGIAVTPMQMAAAYSAIANGGILRAPHIVDAVGGVKRAEPQGRRVISEKTAAEMRTMLEGVTGPGGTASGAEIKGYTLAGKTGTAEKAIAGGYSKTKYVASFVGFAPAQDPQLLVAVMVDEPQGEIYGGLIAAPAFKAITSFALTYLQIPPK
jgi:cell division protein FtsI/penicillin-binding protein 2